MRIVLGLKYLMPLMIFTSRAFAQEDMPSHQIVRFPLQPVVDTPLEQEAPPPGKYKNSMTPYQVLDGTAKNVGHYEGSLMLAIGLKIPHSQEEEELLAQMQDRSSPQFHKFLTPEEWNARFAPSAEDEQKLVDWATANGFEVKNRFPNRLLVDIEGPVDVIEKAFHVTINRYEVNGEVDYSNDRDPIIPESLANIIQSVAGMNNINRMQSQGHNHPGSQ